MKTQRFCTSEPSFDTVPKFSSISEISYDATCATLNFDCKLACPICVGKIDIFRKASSCKKTKFRYLSERLCYEQRQKIDYISNKLKEQEPEKARHFIKQSLILLYLAFLSAFYALAIILFNIWPTKSKSTLFRSE